MSLTIGDGGSLLAVVTFFDASADVIGIDDRPPATPKSSVVRWGFPSSTSPLVGKASIRVADHRHA